MKKSRLLVLVVVAVLVASLLCACAPQEQGYKLEIETVYAMAKEAGYTGTLEELVELFKGSKGDKGDKGDAGVDGVAGVGISKAEISADGHLLITYTNSEEAVDLGQIIFKPEEPTKFYGFTEAELDAIPGVKAADFDTATNAAWNFGWEGNGTLEHNATKVDFDGTKADTDVVWRYKTVGNSTCENAGWGVNCRTTGADSSCILYNKISVPANCNQFRIWAVTCKNQHWSGSGAIKVTAIYRDVNGQYTERVLQINNDTFVIPGDAPLRNVSFNDGWLMWRNSTEWNIPQVLDGCVLVYNMDFLRGMEDVVIVIETAGTGSVLGTEETEVAEGVLEGDVMPEAVIIKRIMFLAA